MIKEKLLNGIMLSICAVLVLIAVIYRINFNVKAARYEEPVQIEKSSDGDYIISKQWVHTQGSRYGAGHWGYNALIGEEIVHMNNVNFEKIDDSVKCVAKIKEYDGKKEVVYHLTIDPDYAKEHDLLRN